ncbi:hypothetical protein NF699_06380 [Sphingomonadaceae bacterium OTU29LAMAA1]|uniref:hypothetical protein n=1 Tax=Sphingomonas sp. Leaf37 TaxID=2876552 RepID=UPI001E3AE277|nr:hypothetical protein [Sphingomonas sp. Leaf37]USU06283.1 hypothetical protein NF699_06380 [Sphingomonadaceae bacterium OTU29LAMAA1]
MTAPVNPPPWWAPFVPVISLIIVIAGVVQMSGGYLATLKDHTKRIDQLEADARTDAKTRTEMLQQLDLRLARIEVKLEMMAEPKGKAP